MKPVPAVCLVGVLCVPCTALAQLRAQPIVPGNVFSGPAVAYVADPAVRGVFYIVKQEGVVEIVVRFTSPTPNAFIDLRSVVSTGGERGLLGMAFPPDTATSGYVFFSFTDLNGDLVVARFNRTFGTDTGAVSATPRAVPGTRLELVDRRASHPAAVRKQQWRTPRVWA